jgi:hypothetical protein
LDLLFIVFSLSDDKRKMGAKDSKCSNDNCKIKTNF